MQKVTNTLKSWGLVGWLIIFFLMSYLVWNILPFIFAFAPDFVADNLALVAVASMLISIVVGAFATRSILRNK